MAARNMTTGPAIPLARFSAQARLRALQSDILELILERDLVPGDPLPTENELTAALGVGRNTLRESLKALQALGVIEIRHGFGMFVAPSNFEALTDGLTFRVKEILEGVFQGKSFAARNIPRDGAAVTHHDTAGENVKHLKEVVPQGVG